MASVWLCDMEYVTYLAIWHQFGYVTWSMPLTCLYCISLVMWHMVCHIFSYITSVWLCSIWCAIDLHIWHQSGYVAWSMPLTCLYDISLVMWHGVCHLLGYMASVWLCSIWCATDLHIWHQFGYVAWSMPLTCTCLYGISLVMWHMVCHRFSYITSVWLCSIWCATDCHI